MAESVHVKSEARRELTVFLEVFFVTALVAYFVYVRSPRSDWYWDPLVRWSAISWVPAIAAMVTRALLLHNSRDVSFRIRGEWVGQAMLIGWLAPVASGLLTYGLVWFSSPLHFRQDSSWGPERIVGINIAAHAPLQAFGIRIGACLFYSGVLCLQSAGEEIGWRGFVLTRLYDAKVSAPLFWNGLLAGLWWLPIMLHNRRKHEPEPFAISFFFFVAGAIAASYLIGYLRLHSGSVWPAVICRASANSVLGFGFASFLYANGFVQGEVYLLNFAVWALAMFFVKRPWPVRYFPKSAHDISETAFPACAD